MGRPDRVVEAAGCVVWRRADGGGAEVLVVHRPAPHDDWSLPKGKLEPGESHRDAAVREVLEETGVRGEIGADLAEVRYRMPSGAEKRVRFWALEAVSSEPREPDDEVDGYRWVPASPALGAALTWETDRAVIGEFLALSLD
jgi:8-oxo-dGTP pyrophosphatase MutT (NUDIX family)